MEENKKTESRKLSNKKYYDKIKQDQDKIKQDQDKKQEQNKILKNKKKILDNIKECQNEIKQQETKEEYNWLYETIIGGIQMMGQTLIQAGMTMSIPLIIMYLKPNITTPLISTSQQVSKQEEKSIQQPITSLSSL